MKNSTVILGLVGALMAVPAAASACDTSLGYLFMRTSMERPTITGGIQIQPAESQGPTYLIPSVDVAIPLGDGGVVRPMLGYCIPSGGDSADGSESEIVFGGGGAFNVWNNPDGTLGINVQAAVTAYSFEGGSEQVFPISVAGSFEASESASLVFGAGLQVGRFSFESESFSSSDTDSDPFAFLGGMFNSGDLEFQAGLEIKKGDSDTDIALNGAISVPIG